MAAPAYIQNIVNYFKSLTSAEAVKASEPKDWKTTINARDGKLVGLCNFFKLKRLLDIDTRTLTEVELTPATMALPTSSSEQATATAKYDNGDQAAVTNGAVWSSDNESVATVTQGGLVSSVSAGSASITAVYGGVTSNEISVTVF